MLRSLQTRPDAAASMRPARYAGGSLYDCPKLVTRGPVPQKVRVLNVCESPG